MFNLSSLCLRRIYTTTKIGPDSVKHWSGPDNFCKEIVGFAEPKEPMALWKLTISLQKLLHHHAFIIINIITISSLQLSTFFLPLGWYWYFQVGWHNRWSGLHRETNIRAVSVLSPRKGNKTASFCTALRCIHGLFLGFSLVWRRSFSTRGWSISDKPSFWSASGNAVMTPITNLKRLEQ